MELIREDSRWPLVAIDIGASLFIVALALSVFFDRSILLLHALQALIYIAIIVLAHRDNALAYGAGLVVAVLWNGANLFVTGFVAGGLDSFAALIHSGHIVAPVFLLILVGETGHFLLIAGCLARFLQPGRPRRWRALIGGMVLGIAALASITPLRLRLHNQPLPLDVPPQLDVVTRGHPYPLV